MAEFTQLAQRIDRCLELATHCLIGIYTHNLTYNLTHNLADASYRNII